MLPDITFATCGLRETVQRLEELAASGKRHYACFCEANLFTSAWRSPAVSAAIQDASLVLADGVSVLLFARLRGMRVPKRVPGPMVMPALCAHGVKAGLRHFFLGGGPGVAERLVAHLQAEIPDLHVAGLYSPPYRALADMDNDDILRRVAEAKPDVLWVGLGAPKQELWMAAQRGRAEVPLMLGVGAAFDFHAGTKLWAPLWIRKLGMEWAFRMLTGGSQTLKRNLRCVSLMVLALALATLRWRPGRASAASTSAARS
ncbi:MAG: WecB/TagA/CpsF family glycosyltransferase [Lentisphaerae bacterium]|nr:WecB/TagA/CpsF family glycosyltransferase [Lentisphaerota bacterium]